MLNERWQTAHDLCSLAASNVAFSTCNRGDVYDLRTEIYSQIGNTLLTKHAEAMWQLIGLSAWIVSFAEKLMRECVLSYDLKKPASNSDDLFGSAPCMLSSSHNGHHLTAYFCSLPRTGHPCCRRSNFSSPRTPSGYKMLQIRYRPCSPFPKLLEIVAGGSRKCADR